MWASKMRYNEDTRKIELIEFDIKNEFDFSNDPKTNFTESKNGHNCQKDSALKCVESINSEIENGITKIKKCKNCGDYFLLPKEEEIWFLERGLVVPKRCPFCRGKKR